MTSSWYDVTCLKGLNARFKGQAGIILKLFDFQLIFKLPSWYEIAGHKGLITALG
jgi:hypothetical protein